MATMLMSVVLMILMIFMVTLLLRTCGRRYINSQRVLLTGSRTKGGQQTRLLLPPFPRIQPYPDRN